MLLSNKLKYASAFLVVFLFIVFPLFSQMRQVYSDPSGTYNEIQKISFYTPSAGYIASTGNSFPWVGFTTDSGRTISKKLITLSNVDYNGYSVNITFGFGIAGVKAFSQDTLIAYGDYGLVPAILYSTNGGSSFKLVYHSQFDPFQLSGPVTDIVFPENNNIGYAIDADRILKTTNKGLSWSVIRIDPGSFFSSLEPFDNNNVFAMTISYGSSKLLKTSNAGNTWQQIPLPTSTLFSISFLTTSKGWINVRGVNSNEEIYYTSNGGSTWSLKNNPDIAPFGTFKMKFINDSTGFANGGLFTTYKTSDSGRIWEPIQRDNNFSYFNYFHKDLFVINNTQLWCGGRQDFLEINTNLSAAPIPVPYFKIDTIGLSASNIVKLVNYSKPGYQFKWYKNDTLISTNYNTSYTHNISNPLDSIKLIVTNTTGSDSVVQYQHFNVAPPPPVPTIASFSPASGWPGTVVTITGTNLSGATAVSFGGIPAASFSVVSSTTITAVVGPGASGSVAVTTPLGTASRSGFVFSTRLVITSFSPTSGPVGSIITINGTNFSPVASNNLVSFGAARANVISASTTQLQVEVPFGTTYDPISVSVNRLTAYSVKPFLITFLGGCNLTSNSFGNKVDSSADLQIKDIVISDLDGDGRVDPITGGNHFNRLTYLRNTSSLSNISFANKSYLEINPGFYGAGQFIAGDMDGDGKPDIVATNGTSPYGFCIFRNTSSVGSISFAPKINITNPYNDQPSSLSIIDLDGDGKPEIIGIEYSAQSVSVFKNNSTVNEFSFSYLTPLSVGSGGGSIQDCKVADINLDGKPDIVLSTNFYQTPKIVVLRNTTINGVISFAPKVEFSIGNNASQNTSSIGDYDGDGKLDVAVSQKDIAKISIARNTSAGSTISFATPIDLTTAVNSGNISSGDIDGDGKPDIIMSSIYYNSFSVFINNSVSGTIQFGPKTDYGVENYPFSYAATLGDINNDGKTDVATINYHFNSVTSATDPCVSIFKNNVCETQTIQVCEGDTISITSNITGASYQWQQNNGTGFVNITNNANFSGTQTQILQLFNIPATWNGHQYRCIVNGNNSFTFSLYVNAYVTPSVDINMVGNTICAGSTATFNSVVVNGGSTPTYQWQLNGVNAGSNSATFSTSNLNTGDKVKLTIQTSASCASQLSANDSIIVTVTPTVQDSVVISVSANNICSGTPVTFTATPYNGGPNPVFHWYINGILTASNINPFTTSSIYNGAPVKALMTTSLACASPLTDESNIIVMSVSQTVTPSVTIAASGTSICSGSSVTFTATPSGGGTSPVYQWQINGVNAGTNSNIFTTSSLTNGAQVTVKLTSNASCVTTPLATSNTITVTVNNIVVPALTITGVTTVNSGQATLLTASHTNGGAAPTYQWQDSTSSHTWQNISGGTGNTLNYTPAATGNKTRCILTSNAACATPATVTSNTLVFTVNTVTAVSNVPAQNYGIKFFPNPVTTSLTIDNLKLSDKWESLYMLSADGKQKLLRSDISNMTKLNVNIESAPAGFYIIVLRRKSGPSAFLKIIKL